MKRTRLMLALLIVMVNSYAQVFEESNTIEDYFKLINEDWICDFNDSYEKIVDVRNGYIAFKSLEDDIEPIFQMALFRDYQRNDLIVIHAPGYACADIFDCPATEERKTYFLNYENEEWVDVSHSVLPQVHADHFYRDSTIAKIVNQYAPHAIAYALPQFGQTITLKLEICEDYINFDKPDDPDVSDEHIEKLMKERQTLLLKWNKKLRLFQLEK